MLWRTITNDGREVKLRINYVKLVLSQILYVNLNLTVTREITGGSPLPQNIQIVNYIYKMLKKRLRFFRTPVYHGHSKQLCYLAFVGFKHKFVEYLMTVFYLKPSGNVATIDFRVFFLVAVVEI